MFIHSVFRLTIILAISVYQVCAECVYELTLLEQKPFPVCARKFPDVQSLFITHSFVYFSKQFLGGNCGRHCLLWIKVLFMYLTDLEGTLCLC